MATPFDIYIRFLVTKGFDSLRDVNDHLAELAIAKVPDEAFVAQYDLVEKSLPERIFRQLSTKQYEGDFLKWMKFLEIEEFWQGEKNYVVPEVKRRITVITGIHDDPYLKLCLNGLLIKNVNSKDTTDIINSRFSALLKEEHIDLYRKYFFDPRRLTRKDWKQFIKDQPNREKHIYFTALNEPLDVLKTELELPAQVSVSEPLQFLLTKSFQKAKDYLNVGTKEANAEARAWISQVVMLSEKYEKFKSGDKTDFAKQLQMEFDFIDNEFPQPDVDTMKELMDDQENKKHIDKA